MLTSIDRSALLPYSAGQVYALVNDVESYPLYMDGCTGARILESSEEAMVARLELKKRGISYSFVTRNRLEPGESISLDLENGPFRQLRGLWLFKALSEKACKVSLHLEFEPNNRLLGIAATSLFTGVANNLVNALSKRAEQVYGTG